MKSYTIHLIRHGLTAGNAEGRYVGSTDLPLSASGVQRLEALAKKSPYPKAEAFFCSPLKRCTQTMRIIYPNAKPILIDGFRECDFGAWEGKTAKEIAAGDPAFARWISGEGKEVTPPGGESGAEFFQRTCLAFEKVVKGLMTSGITTAAIVAHGGTLMSILSAYGLPRAQFYDWMTESGCGYSMRITPGLWMRSMVGEVYAKIPEEKQKEPGNGVMLIDLAREAAEKSLGKVEDHPEEKKKDENGG